MTPFQLMLALKARIRIVIGVLLLTLIAAWVSYLLIPKNYKTTATIILNYKGTDPITGSSVPGQAVSGYMPTYMSTQIDVINSITVALRVVDQMQLQNHTYFRNEYVEKGGAAPMRDWIGEFLLSNLKIEPSKKSSVLEVTYKAARPDVAAAIANGFVRAYLSTNAELTAAPAKDASGYFGEQLNQLRLAMEQAQNKVSEYQHSNGIVNIDNRVDVENARLNELSSQLAIAQSQTTEAVARRDFAKGASSASPDVANSSVTQALELELSKARMRMGEIADRFTPEHPVYVRARANVRRAEALLRQHMNDISKVVGNNARIFEQREATLHSALDEQKKKVLDLNRKRDELGLLVRDLDTVRHNYETVSKRLAQTSIQGQSSQADVSVLANADSTRASKSPSFSLTMSAAALLGLTLGSLAAFVSEWLNRRVRSLPELERLLGVPVLASIDNLVPAHRSMQLVHMRPALNHSLPSLPKA